MPRVSSHPDKLSQESIWQRFCPKCSLRILQDPLEEWRRQVEENEGKCVNKQKKPQSEQDGIQTGVFCVVHGSRTGAAGPPTWPLTS